MIGAPSESVFLPSSNEVKCLPTVVCKKVKMPQNAPLGGNKILESVDALHRLRVYLEQNSTLVLASCQ